MDDDWGVAPFQETSIYDDHLTMGYTKCIEMFFFALVFQMGDSSAKKCEPQLDSVILIIPNFTWNLINGGPFYFDHVAA